MGSQGFSAWDYVVFCATVVTSISIGIFFAIWDRKRDTPLNYFLAGKRSSVAPMTLSLVVTFQSSLMIIGTPAEVYLYGMKQIYMLVGVMIAFIVSGVIIAPVFHPLGFTSVYRYFHMRYHNNSVRYLTMCMGMIFNVCYIGTVTFGTCVALEVVIGIPLWAGILLYTVISTVYTSIGGIKAVIWSDVFQTVMMIIGLVALLCKAIIDSGGLPQVLTVASSRLQMSDFRLDPRIRYQFWNASIGGFASFFCLSCSQSAIQRINSTPSVKTARLVYIIAAPLFTTLWLLPSFLGVSFFAYYSHIGCDPIEFGRAKNYNQLVPIAVLDLFQSMPGLAGLFIASLSSGALSTLSSCLSSLSAITYDDIILEKFPNISDKRATLLSKIVVLGFGVIGLIVAFIVSTLGSTVLAAFIAFTGCLNGPYSAIFLLSVMSRRITSKGSFIGGIIGIVITFWIIMGQTLTKLPDSDKLPPGPIDMCYSKESGINKTLSAINSFADATSTSTLTSLSSTTEAAVTGKNSLTALEDLYSISFVLSSLVGFLTTVIVAIVVSFFTRGVENLDERCLFSFRRHMFSKESVKGDSKTSTTEGETSEECHELMSKSL